MKLSVKIHQKDDRTVLAVCDAELLGSVYEENGVQLDLKSEFFDGEFFEKVQDVGDLMRNADCVYLVGEESVKIGMMEDIVQKEDVKYVDGVPHVQVVIIHEE